jgi:DNA invertase Pin-like site-specific DNA recombinase
MTRPTPWSGCCSTCWRWFAEFEADLIRARTREGMRVAKAKGRLRGKRPKLTDRQEAHLVALHRAGEHTGAELAELFNVARSTVYRALKRAEEDAPTPHAA